jgi:GNAT superfamily N-acetyltransferase
LNKDNAIVGVIGPSDNIKAIIYLCVDQVYYSEEVQLVEMWNFVRKDCRKSDYAKRMIQFAKKCADDVGCDLTIGIISDERLEAKERLYARLLPKGGTFFIYHGKKEPPENHEAI